MDQKIFFDILQSREDRALFQEEIINEYKAPIISFTLNIPGKIKDSLIYREIHNAGMEAISKSLNDYEIINTQKKEKSTGPEGYFSVNINPIELKQLTTKIEIEHPLGRLFDIDVLDINHEQISRSELGLEPRKCMICENNAKECSRSKKHSLEEVLEVINHMYTTYFKDQSISK